MHFADHLFHVSDLFYGKNNHANNIISKVNRKN